MDKESSQQTLLEKLERTMDECFSFDELKQKLNSGRQLRLKYGVDLTAPTLHIGHAVNLWMLRHFQDHGHKVVFMIGDTTTRVGDPTGKSKTRKEISEEQLKENEANFLEQVKQVLRFDDSDLIEFRRNSEWYDQINTSGFLNLLKFVTHDHLISRDMFKERIKNDREIRMHEMVYPILQAFDSVKLESDVTIIGTDQLFNEMLGRHFQQKWEQDPQVIITTVITAGIDGKEKQSKSLGNFIGLAHSPREKFGRVMSIPDDLIVDYLKVYTNVSMETVREVEKELPQNARDHKLFLAREIVARYHGEDVAKGEQEWFLKTFSEGKVPEDAPVVKVDTDSVHLLHLLKTGLDETSNSEIRRLISQRAVRVDGEIKSDPEETIAIPENGVILKVGKRRWFKVKL